MRRISRLASLITSLLLACPIAIAQDFRSPGFRFEKSPDRPSPSPSPSRSERQSSSRPKETGPSKRDREYSRIEDKAIADYKAGRWKEAEAGFRRLIALDPGATAYNSLGSSLMHQQRLDEAEAAYRSALRYDSQNARANAGLAGVTSRKALAFSQKGDWEKALEYCRNAQRYEPDEPKWRENVRIAEQALRDKQTGEQTKRVANLSAEEEAKQTDADFQQLSKDVQSLSTPADSLDFVGPNVVDLRDAKTLTVDPSRVSGDAKTQSERRTASLPETLKAMAKELETAHDSIRKKQLAAFDAAHMRTVQEFKEEMKKMEKEGIFHVHEGEDLQRKAREDPAYRLAVEVATKRVEARRLEQLVKAEREAQDELLRELRRILGPSEKP